MRFIGLRKRRNIENKRDQNMPPKEKESVARAEGVRLGLETAPLLSDGCERAEKGEKITN